MNPPPDLRQFRESDWPALWPILHETFRAGDTYAVDPRATEADLHRYWIESPLATYVAADPRTGQLLGTAYLRPNQPGPGSHVCNCGYVVAPAARGCGVATALCLHTQAEARARGFLAMQFNLVVSTNTPAIHLWRKLGFATVGTLPRTFRHPRLGFVDAYVMFKSLAPDPSPAPADSANPGERT